jgi:quinol monooxygenase YgiN
MMPFVQIIEFQTDKIDEYNATVDAWLKSSAGRRTPTRSTLTQDRDRPGTYMTIVEFPSYEEAMENSNQPETGEFSARLAALCKGAPTFRNLDVVRQEDM